VWFGVSRSRVRGALWAERLLEDVADQYMRLRRRQIFRNQTIVERHAEQRTWIVLFVVFNSNPHGVKFPNPGLTRFLCLRLPNAVSIGFAKFLPAASLI